MPEGDTIWRVARELDQALAGGALTGTDFRTPRLAATDLTGWSVAEVASRGKHLLVRLREPATDPGRPPDTPRRLTLHSHLRMDGLWRVYSPTERWTARPTHLIRVVLRTAGAVAVGYHLHDVTLARTADEHRLVGHLGPDLLGPDWDAPEAIRRLRERPTADIGDALLDQHNLAGMGNVYRAEVLFLSGLSPWLPVGDVPDLPAVVELAHRLLSANRDRSIRTTTGMLRNGETSYVYGRRGRPCRRCGTPIRSIEGDRLADRVTYWCPRCQPAPPEPPAKS
jgi:endonuclease VIII